MTRPYKCRRIGFSPESGYFKPAGIPLRELEEVVLTLDEVEALRLAHLEGLYHKDGASKMKVSRQTFGNIVNSACRKIADGIVNAKAIKIEGGVYELQGMRTFRCGDCRHEWSENFGTGRPANCPECDSENIRRAKDEQGCGGKCVKGETE